MLTVKSPSSNCSRISLQGDKQPQRWTLGAPGAGLQAASALDPDVPGAGLQAGSADSSTLSKARLPGLPPSTPAFLMDRANRGPTYMSMAQQTRRRKSKRLSSAKSESQIRMTSGSKNSCDSRSVSQRKAKNWGLIFCSCWEDSRGRVSAAERKCSPGAGPARAFKGPRSRQRLLQSSQCL